MNSGPIVRRAPGLARMKRRTSMNFKTGSATAITASVDHQFQLSSHETVCPT